MLPFLVPSNNNFSMEMLSQGNILARECNLIDFYLN
jgi:hypothetical protein